MRKKKKKISHDLLSAMPKKLLNASFALLSARVCSFLPLGLKISEAFLFSRFFLLFAYSKKNKQLEFIFRRKNMKRVNKELIKYYSHLLMEEKNLSEMGILDKFLMIKRAEIHGFEKTLNIIKGQRFLGTWVGDNTLEIRVYNRPSTKPVYKTLFNLSNHLFGGKV